MDENKTAMESPKFDPKDVEANKGIACLSYIGILFLVPMLARKDSKFAQTHAKQGMVMFIAALLMAVPIVGWIWGLLVLAVDVFSIINTLQGKFWQIPGAYQISRKFNF